MTIETETAPAVASETTLATDSTPIVEALADNPADAPDDSGEGSEDSLDADLRAIYRKNNPDRDESGRFRGTKPADDPAAVEGEETEVSPDQPLVEEPKQAITPAIPPPQTWSAEEKAEWNNLPPKAQEAIARRDREAQQALSRQGNELKAVEPIRNVIEQHRDVFERSGVTPDDGINRLLTVERMLEQNPVAALAQIAEAYGVDLTQFGQGQQPDPQSEAGQLHQRIAWLESQLQETSHRVAQRERAEATTQVQSITNMIEKFSSDKQDWSELEADVHAEIVGIKAAVSQGIIPPMTTEETLAKAYERAQRNNPVAWERKLEAERKAQNAKLVEEARKRTEDARRAKVMNVSSAPTKSRVALSMEDSLREAYRQATSKG